MAIYDIISHKNGYLEPKLSKKMNLELLLRVVDLLEMFQDEKTHTLLDKLIRYINGIEDKSDFINVRKDYLKCIRELTNHLKTQYDLSPKGIISSQYIAIGIAIGSGIGVALGQSNPAFYGIGIGMGVAVGRAVGKKKEKEALEAGKLY